MVLKRHHVLWAKAHLKWTVSKWKSVLWSDESKFDILVGNHRHRVLWAKEEGDFQVCYQHLVQKPASLMVWGGVHKCIRYGQLACFGRHYECWKVYIKDLEQYMLPSRRRLFQQDNPKLHTAAITTAWLRSIESRCWISLPAVQIQSFHLKRIFGASLNEKYVHNHEPISGRNGTRFQHQNSRSS